MRTLCNRTLIVIATALLMGGWGTAGLTADAMRRHVALPELSDRMGWKQARHYSTIQTADVDGDGQSEVLGRSIFGVNVYRFQNGTLLAHSFLPQLSDSEGFHQASWYRSLRTGVLDASTKQADIIARKSDGVHVFRYDKLQKRWYELGSRAGFRPFADGGSSDGTDWTQPQHYETLRLADLNADGVTELLGRGRTGLQAYQWDSAAQTWKVLGEASALSDGQGFAGEPYYYSLQLLDVDRDGISELLIRSPDGMQTYKWKNSSWDAELVNGPFADADGFGANKRYKSVRTWLDASGRAWLYGLAPGNSGPGSGSIEVYRWQQQQQRWSRMRSIELPGKGWDRESQFSTLSAANLRSGATPEFIVRGPRGLLAFSLDGDLLSSETKSFPDSQGWNLPEQYSTIQPVTATISENGVVRPRTVVMGRGAKGLEVYKFRAGSWNVAAETNFPQYCSDFEGDASAPCIAYKTIGQRLIAGQVDIRSVYTEFGFAQADWIIFQSTLQAFNNPNGSNTDPAWVTVKSQIVNELGYVAAVRGWFSNNYQVLNNSYNRSADLLGQAQNDVSLANNTSVVAKWLEFAGDIVSAIAGVFPGGGNVQLVISILEDTYNATASSSDLTEQIAQLYTDLNAQRVIFTTVNATAQTAYLVDYSKLQQIGTNSANGGLDWANATLDQIAAAQNGAASGMLINFYKALIPSKWQVLWCGGESADIGLCGAVDTPANYDCTFGNAYNLTHAYIATGQPPFSPPLNWNLADKLTGVLPGELNAIWYPMMLGGNLGWDLPGTQTLLTNRGVKEVPGLSPQLSYDNIVYGLQPEGSARGCEGAGSTTGRIGGNQQVSQYLTVAQHNPRRLSSKEAKQLVNIVIQLQGEVRNGSSRNEIRRKLLDPLQTAETILKRGSPPSAGVAATTPIHLLEWFIGKVQQYEPEIGREQSEALVLKGYRVIERMQGQMADRRDKESTF